MPAFEVDVECVVTHLDYQDWSYHVTSIVLAKHDRKSLVCYQYTCKLECMKRNDNVALQGRWI